MDDSVRVSVSSMALSYMNDKYDDDDIYMIHNKYDIPIHKYDMAEIIQDVVNGYDVTHAHTQRDHALTAHVIHTHTSASIYDKLSLWHRVLHHTKIKFYGFPAEAALSATQRHPANSHHGGLGQCWAFGKDDRPHDDDVINNHNNKGLIATLTLELAEAINVFSVVIEHPLNVTPNPHTAIRHFRILGYVTANLAVEEPWELGSFVFDIHNDVNDDVDSKEVQEFVLSSSSRSDVSEKKNIVPKMRVIVLAVDSNWGHEDYSCLYRFRIHAEIDEE